MARCAAWASSRPSSTATSPGWRRSQSRRRLGPGGHDQQHRFAVLEPIAAPEGLGVVEEFEYARTRTTRPLKVTLPGPFTLSGRLTYGPGEVYADRIATAEAFVPILAAELERLVAAGATYIQIDEPSPAIHPEASDEFAALFNAAAAGVVGPRLPGRAPLLRQLPGPAALEARLPAGAGAGARLRRRRAGARVGQPRDGGAGRGGRGHGRRPAPLGRRHRRQELLPRDGRRRRRAHRAAPRGRRARGAPLARARLRLQPDRSLGDEAQAGGAGGRPRPRAGPRRRRAPRPRSAPARSLSRWTPASAARGPRR